MEGINGSILRVDLTAGKLTVQTVSAEHYQRYLSGRGIIVHTLFADDPIIADSFGEQWEMI